MAVSGALLARLLSLLLVVSTTTTVALAAKDLNESIKIECDKAKEPQVCRDLLMAHPECATANVISACELALQVTAKIAREADNFSRSLMKDMASPSPCLAYCVRDICAAAQKVAGVPAVIAEADWAKIAASLKREVTWTCGKSCPEKPSPDEQAVLQKFTELKSALCVTRDLVLADSKGNGGQPAAQGAKGTV